MSISPLYYFVEMGYGILLQGAGWDILWVWRCCLAWRSSGWACGDSSVSF